MNIPRQHLSRRYLLLTLSVNWQQQWQVNRKSVYLNEKPSELGH